MIFSVFFQPYPHPPTSGEKFLFFHRFYLSFSPIGLTLAGAVKGCKVRIILPDTGERYFSTLLFEE